MPLIVLVKIALKFLMIISLSIFISIKISYSGTSGAIDGIAENKYIQQINRAVEESDSELKVLTSLKLVKIYIQKGKILKAHDLLLWIKPEITSEDNPRVISEFYIAYGTVFLKLNSYEKAISLINSGLLVLDGINAEDEKAALLNTLGSVYLAVENYKDSVNAFERSYNIAKSSDNNKLESIAATNLAGALTNDKDEAKFDKYIGIAEDSIFKLREGYLKANNLITLGIYYREAQRVFKKEQNYRLKSLNLYQQAMHIAASIDNKVLLSYAYGYIGQLYEDERRLDESLTYTRKALFFAQESKDDKSLYQWQWQIARLYRDLGDFTASRDSYKYAINTLTYIRSDITKGTKNTFQQLVGPIYYEYTDLLLSHTQETSSDLDFQEILNDVKSTIEQLKTAEIEDYFDSDCSFDNKATLLANISHKSAIIYPIILNDRLEILVNINDIIYQRSAKIKSEYLINTIHNLRGYIENYNSGDGYMTSSQYIYDLLIQPVETLLEEHNVKTLVFVPDGAFRTIPMSVLHDGDEYLIEKYSIAITQGVNMTPMKGFVRNDVNVLATGISESVHGFNPLPSVKKELNNINNIHKSKIYLNDEFVINDLDIEIENGEYSIVHIATHGEFNSNHKESFLLAYDKKLTLPKLEELINKRDNENEPIELLVLSACQTAKGDDRAALGLAGVALRAGAKSALATLWYISDDATSELITVFYKNLKKSNLSKSEALREAQISLIRNHRYQHPAYWAAFILIGNWL